MILLGTLLVFFLNTGLTLFYSSRWLIQTYNRTNQKIWMFDTAFAGTPDAPVYQGWNIEAEEEENRGEMGIRWIPTVRYLISLFWRIGWFRERIIWPCLLLHSPLCLWFSLAHYRCFSIIERLPCFILHAHWYKPTTERAKKSESLIRHFRGPRMLLHQRWTMEAEEGEESKPEGEFHRLDLLSLFSDGVGRWGSESFGSQYANQLF